MPSKEPKKLGRNRVEKVGKKGQRRVTTPEVQYTTALQRNTRHRLYSGLSLVSFRILVSFCDIMTNM